MDGRLDEESGVGLFDLGEPCPARFGVEWPLDDDVGDAGERIVEYARRVGATTVLGGLLPCLRCGLGSSLKPTNNAERKGG